MQELVAKGEYAGAAALQSEMEARSRTGPDSATGQESVGAATGQVDALSSSDAQLERDGYTSRALKSARCIRGLTARSDGLPSKKDGCTSVIIMPFYICS